MEDLLKAVSADGSSIMPKIAPHLSRHLLFPLIQFEGDQAEEAGDADRARKILTAKLALLEDTNMADYVATLTADADATAQVSSVVEGTQAGTVLIGSSREFVCFDRSVEPALVRRIARRAVRLFPVLADVQLLRTYVGFRPDRPPFTGGLVPKGF
jgi:glycine/D-amino acid oxidase-like deaminating enzyme